MKGTVVATWLATMREMYGNEVVGKALAANSWDQDRIVNPMEEIDDEEVKRIQKVVEKLTKDIASIGGRLANENFVKNAAEDVVEADRHLLDQSKTQLQSLQEALVRLQS